MLPSLPPPTEHFFSLFPQPYIKCPCFTTFL
uniref:Uncharacterized protein n=1 Tax=Caudovirales sp. ctCiv1 TaxID=2826769 RepID=A0A8S5M8K3_9CAUD|nr:MAG TPA: hypothetical protein [Caudovirales sp. ctCiv1]